LHGWSGIQGHNGVNESAVHVDMVKSMIEGEITAGDEVIYSKAKYFYGTNPDLYDTDGDGLSDGAEVNTYGTNPLNWNTDWDLFRHDICILILYAENPAEQTRFR